MLVSLAAVFSLVTEERCVTRLKDYCYGCYDCPYCVRCSIHGAKRQTTSSFKSTDVEMIRTSFERNKMMLLNYDESSCCIKPRPNDRNIQRNILPNIVGSCRDLLRRAGQTHATSRNNLRNFSEYLWPPVSCRLGRKHGVCS